MITCATHLVYFLVLTYNEIHSLFRQLLSGRQEWEENYFLYRKNHVEVELFFFKTMPLQTKGYNDKSSNRFKFQPANPFKFDEW